MKVYKISLFFSRKANLCSAILADIISVFTGCQGNEKKNFWMVIPIFFGNLKMTILNNVLLSNNFDQILNNIKKYYA